MDVLGDKIIVGSTSSHAFIYNGSRWSTYSAPYHVYGTKIDTLGNYWMCGIGFFIKYDGRKTITYNRYNTSLPEYGLNDIFIDSKNRKWISNGNGGVDLLNEPVWKDYGPYNEGLFANPVPYTTVGQATTEDKFNNIWMAYFGTYGGVVEIPRGDETDTTNWIKWETANAGVDLQFIHCISADSIGNVWVGLDHNSTVDVYNSTTRQWKSFKLTDYGLNGASDTKVQSIETDIDGNVWCVSELGLVKFDKFGNHFTTYSIFSTPGLPQAVVYDIAFDSKGNKWIASDSGLVKYDGVHWTTYNESNSGILASHTQSVAVGRRDTIFAGTFNTIDYPYYGGLSIFDGNNYWKTFAEGSSPIPHKQVEDVEVDKLGNVWLNCQSEGIAVYHNGGVKNAHIPCGEPAHTFTSDITNYSAILNWQVTAGGAQYQVKYKKDGSRNFTIVNTTSPRLILSGLQPSTKYQWIVRSKCWKEQYSPWSLVNTFTTKGNFAKLNQLPEKNLSNNIFVVQPNPVSGYCQVRFISTTQAINEFSITDMQGKVLIRKTVNAIAGNNNFSFDVSALAKGTYLLQRQSNDEASVLKIIKE